MKIPSQYLPIMPYLIVRDAEAFLEFSKKVFGAAEQMIVPGEDGRKIMHGEIRIHDAVVMFSGANESWPEKTAGMFVYVDNVDNVYASALENGAKSLMAQTTQEYGYTAGFEDPFGNHWWIVQGE